MTQIAEAITLNTGQIFAISDYKPLTGGDINAAFCLKSNHDRYFVKLNRPELIFMFEAEAAGLRALSDTQTIKVPQVISVGQTKQHAFLVLEYLDLGPSTQNSDRLLGQQLATLHRLTQPFFGWYRNNTIGSTLQINDHNSDWTAFWREHRLGFQLKLAAKNGYGGKLQQLGEKLSSHLSMLLQDHHPQPSLLHGDLWGGNIATNRQGAPVIYDPACYFGDREADLAMTELFGGFSQDFRAAYQDIWPVNAGYTLRKTLYNLYHILNHLNLFGGGYQRQAETMLAMLLAEVR